jgi:hypothetical protein
METEVRNRDIEAGAHSEADRESVAFLHHETVQLQQSLIVAGLPLYSAVVAPSGRRLYAIGIDSEFHDHNVDPTCDRFWSAPPRYALDID